MGRARATITVQVHGELTPSAIASFADAVQLVAQVYGLPADIVRVSEHGVRVDNQLVKRGWVDVNV